MTDHGPLTPYHLFHAVPFGGAGCVEECGVASLVMLAEKARKKLVNISYKANGSVCAREERTRLEITSDSRSAVCHSILEPFSRGYEDAYPQESHPPDITFCLLLFISLTWDIPEHQFLSATSPSR
jgi:hypothetical protein